MSTKSIIATAIALASLAATGLAFTASAGSPSCCTGGNACQCQCACCESSCGSGGPCTCECGGSCCK